MAAAGNDDIVSVGGDDRDPFIPGASAFAQRPDVKGKATSASAGRAFTRTAAPVAGGWGRGPMKPDSRRFRYDVSAALTAKRLPFGATKVDRLDATDAGNILERVHVAFGIDREPEERIFAFDQALWYQHAVNGGSTLQAARGVLRVDGVAFDIPTIVRLLGNDNRRFFRAYADDIASCLRDIINSYDPYDEESVEKNAAIQHVAVQRGLQKYPHLIHDSSDAGTNLSMEERIALQVSKGYVISASVNAADTMTTRVGPVAKYGSAAAIHAVEE